MISPLEWEGDSLRILDQSRLPHEIKYIDTREYHEIIEAIKSLKVRGAPAIGVAAAYGIALAAQNLKATDVESYTKELDSIFNEFASARPTAVNLFKCINSLKSRAKRNGTIENIRQSLLEEAKTIHYEEILATQRISKFGADLIKDRFTILTHCNTGPLATTGYGTALGIILEANKQGKSVNVVATETRPLFQGARLTSWELLQAGIPVKLIIDSAAGYYMKTNKIDCVIIGADHIAANGDTANKIGSYSLAVLAHENRIPFYIAAPVSTVDLLINNGSEIEIEERSQDEVTVIQGIRIAPIGIEAYNPAFDITPGKYITAIITDKGIIRKPYTKNLNTRLKEKK